MATVTTPRTNLATNPRWNETLASVVLRRNIAANPFAVQAGGLWATTTSASGVATTNWITGGPAPRSSTYKRFLITTAPATWMRHESNSSTQTVTVGKTYSLSAWMRSNRTASNGWIGVQWLTSGGATISESSITGMGMTANVWVQKSITSIVAPATAAYVNIYVGYNTNALVGDQLDITEVLFEEGTSVQLPFSGATADTADLTYDWTGATNASPSTLSVLPVAGYVDGAGQSITYRCTDTPTPGSATFARSHILLTTAVGINPADTVLAASVARTSKLWVRSSRTLTVTLRWRAVSGATSNIGSLPLTAGVWTEVEQIGATPSVVDANLGFLLSSGLGHQQGDTIDVAEHMTVEGSEDSEFFDGNTPTVVDDTAFSPAATYTYSWTGPVDASTSVETLSVPLQDYQVELPDETVAGAGTTVGLLEVIGLRGSASTRTSDYDRAGVDGASPGMSFLTARTIAVKWLLTAPGAIESALQILNRNWQNTNDPSNVVMTARDYLMQVAAGGSRMVSALQFQLPGRDLPFLAFGKPGRLDPPVNSEYQHGWLEVFSEWLVPDGKIYDTTVHSATTTLPASNGGAAFPWTFPVNFGPATGGALQVENNGMYPAKPVFKITGPVTNPTITESTSGKFVRVNLAVLAGDTLLIDSDSRVVRLNGSNRNNALDTGSAFFTIPKGGTSLTFSSTDSAGTAFGSLSVYTLNTYSAA